MAYFSDIYIAPIADFSSIRRDYEGLSSLQNELPAYNDPGPSRTQGRSSGEQVHELTLRDSDGHVWATVRFSSKAPSAKSLPVFFEGQDISGQVDFDLKQSESIKSVEVLVSRSVCLNPFILTCPLNNPGC